MNICISCQFLTVNKSLHS